MWQELNLTLASDNGVFRSATDGLASMVGGVDDGIDALGRLSDLFDEIGRQGDDFSFDFDRLRQVGYGISAPRTGPAALPGGVGTGANAGFAAQAQATAARRATLAVPDTVEAAPMRSAELERLIAQATDNVAIRDALSGTIRDVFTGADFTIFSDTDQQAQDQFVRGVIGPLREAFREGAEEEGPRLAANASRLIDFWVNGLQGGAETEDILKAAALRLVSNFFRQVESGEGFSLSGLLQFHEGGVVPGPRGADVLVVAKAGETIIPAGNFLRQPESGEGFSRSRLPQFHEGGVVPGPRGADVPILAQAGETIIPSVESAGGVTVYNETTIVGNVDRAVLQAVGGNSDDIAAGLAGSLDRLGFMRR